jgi:hypothetical protein
MTSDFFPINFVIVINKKNWGSFWENPLILYITKLKKQKPGYDDNSFGVLFITPFVYMFLLQVG